MKILVFSDSHGRSSNMIKAISLHNDARLVVHLGDGTSDAEEAKKLFPDLPFVCVSGNLEDALHPFKKSVPFQVVTEENKTIYLCHGHRHNVSFTEQNLIYAAAERGADLILYGHTHVKDNRYIPENQETGRKSTYLFNPGSISRPRDGGYPSYGVIELRAEGILLSHGIIK